MSKQKNWDACTGGRTRHELYLKQTGEQYCRQCGLIITRSGKHLPPNAGWQPLTPSAEDKPISPDEMNIGWSPKKLTDKRSARIAALRIAIQVLQEEHNGPTRFINTVDQDVTREALLELIAELNRKLLRFRDQIVEGK